MVLCDKLERFRNSVQPMWTETICPITSSRFLDSYRSASTMDTFTAHTCLVVSDCLALAHVLHAVKQVAGSTNDDRQTEDRHPYHYVGQRLSNEIGYRITTFTYR